MRKYLLLLSSLFCVFLSAQDYPKYSQPAFPDLPVVGTGENVTNPTIGYTLYMRDDGSLYWKNTSGTQTQLTFGDWATGIDQAFVTSLGFVPGAHTIDTNLSQSEVVAHVVAEGTFIRAGNIFGTNAVPVWTDNTNKILGYEEPTGTGILVRNNAPSLISPDLNTPTDINLANATNLPAASITATGSRSASTFLNGNNEWAIPIDTDTQLSDSEVATAASNEGFVPGPHTTDTNTQLSDAEVETAYNNIISVITQLEAETGTSTTVRRWTAERVRQAIQEFIGTNRITVGTTAPSSPTIGEIWIDIN